MEPGFYVVRMPARASGSRLMVESRPFRVIGGVSKEWARQQADNWANFVQSENPKDDVFVIEREETRHEG